jgi:NADH-quinone oxidoreductase subunit G
LRYSRVLSGAGLLRQHLRPIPPGQPVSPDFDVKPQRTAGLYAADKMLQLHKSQDNPYVQHAYETTLEQPGSEKAHHLLHTRYHSRKRITDEDIDLAEAPDEEKLQVRVCVGTSCFVRGAQTLLQTLLATVEERGLEDRVDIAATFCFERCDRGPTIAVGDRVIEKCTVAQALEALDEALATNAARA